MRHHGSQPGSVTVGGRRTQVDRPRLGSKDGREVAVPAYEALSRDPKQADRVLSRVLKGISTREYRGVFDESGEELGLSKSNVSRKVAQAGEEVRILAKADTIVGNKRTGLALQSGHSWRK